MFARDIYCCTVKPALRDHSREMLKVVSYSRWSLNKGVRSNDPDVCVGGGGKGETDRAFENIVENEENTGKHHFLNSLQ